MQRPLELTVAGHGARGRLAVRAAAPPHSRLQRHAERRRRDEPALTVEALGAAPVEALQDRLGEVAHAAAGAERAHLQETYAGYVARQSSETERQRMQTEQAIPDDFDYEDVTGLSIEVRQRLKLAQPRTVGQAGRISGVTPAAISLLLVHLKRHSHGRRAA